MDDFRTCANCSFNRDSKCAVCDLMPIAEARAEGQPCGPDAKRWGKKIATTATIGIRG